MAESISINAVISDDYKSLVITDQTDWTAITGTIDDLTSIELYFYTTTTESSDYTYTFTEAQVSEYVANSGITITFDTLFGRVFALDNWYDVLMDGNDGDYISNYAGFLSSAYITTKVYENAVNDLRTPEIYKKTIEPKAMQVINLEGMNYIGKSTLTDRAVKAKLRLDILNRYNP